MPTRFRKTYRKWGNRTSGILKWLLKIKFSLHNILRGMRRFWRDGGEINHSLHEIEKGSRLAQQTKRKTGHRTGEFFFITVPARQKCAYVRVFPFDHKDTYPTLETLARQKAQIGIIWLTVCVCAVFSALYVQKRVLLLIRLWHKGTTVIVYAEKHHELPSEKFHK